MTTRWELERMEPRHGRGDRVVLDPAETAYSIGRSERCAIRLYSPTASRQHAELHQEEAGRWTVRAVEGRTVLADGDPIHEPREVCEGLSLEFGGDRLRCQRQRDESTQPGIGVPPRPGRGRPALAAAVLFVLSASMLALALFWLLD